MLLEKMLRQANKYDKTEIIELDRNIQALQDKRLSLALELAMLDIELASLEV